MSVTRFIGLLLLVSLAVMALGFYYVHYDAAAFGHKLIGGATLFIFLILMPAFIIVRYKNKDLSKFNINPPNKKNKTDLWDD